MKKYIIAAVPVILAIALAGCGEKGSSSAADSVQSAAGNASVSQDAQETPKTVSLDNKNSYLILVNKDNPIPDNWGNDVKLIVSKNSVGENISGEKETYNAYLDLKDALEAEGIDIDISCGYKSINEINNMMIDFGEDYVKQNYAAPGYTEFHTGLALDLYLNINGAPVTDKEVLMDETYSWKKVHEKLSEYGFILRYPEGKEDITGCSYKPWHIRYVGSPETAKDISDKGIALEEYEDVLKVNG